MLLRLILKHAKPYRPWIIAVLVFQLGTTMATLFLPSLNARIIDEGVTQGDTDFIWRTGAMMLMVAFIQVLTAIAAVYFGAKTSMAVGRDIRRGVFPSVAGFSAREVNEFGAPTLITRNTNDVQQVQMLVILGVGGSIMARREDAGLSWLVRVSVPLLVVIVGFLIRLLMPLFRLMQERIDSINGVLREQIIGIRVVRAFVREPYETERFRAANERLTEVGVRVGQLFVLMFPLIGMILHLATAAVLWFGGHRVADGNMEVGSLTAFLQYLLQILMAVMMGTFMAMMIPRAAVCAERIDEVLQAEPSLRDPEVTTVDAPAHGTVEFRRVSFGYPGAEEPVLKDLQFTAEPGRMTAIIGSTGSGKSTLLNLIPRLYDADAGQVLIDGTPVSALTREQLSERVAAVPQRPYLFSGTVASNLRYGNREATDPELWEALRIAQARDFVSGKEGGLESGIAPGGTHVSGGPRQRLCIARALAARPKVYLFDDSFSALDVTTDSRLRAALKETTGEATVIVVAQRVSTIIDADQILVLDDGEIVGRGTHEELLESSATYLEIVESQISAEEVS
ncbi:MAG: ABC transporter ATP-binding protein/permease [Micrococcaceae bacterium]|nr:ABC transporter ATP-binding protein/permease [Micrococcaceae bacterium]